MAQSGGDGVRQEEERDTKEAKSVKAVLEKLSEFLTENNLEQQIEEEKKSIYQRIESKNEDILQKKDTHRHKLTELHEAYKREIQKENERHLEDLKVTEVEIGELRRQLEELEELNYAVSSKIPCSKNNSFISDRRNSGGRMRELLECPVCMEEMKPPKKIFQCSNGHVICELCKNNPEVRSCPTCRVKFRGHNVVRNIVAEKFARSAFDSDESDESLPHNHSRNTRESNPVQFHHGSPEEFHLLGFQPAYGYSRREQEHEEEDGEEEDDFLAWARIIGQGGDERSADSPPSNTTSSGSSNHHRRLGDSGRSNDDGDAADNALSQRLLDSEGGRRNGGDGLSRLREAHLIRTYRPNSRYLPQHMRRQRAGRGDEELEAEEEAADQRMFVRTAPRVVRRSDNVRLFR